MSRSLPVAGLILAVALLAAQAPGSGARPARPASTAASPFVAVSGNRIVNQSGQPVRLLGVNRSGSEYSCLRGRRIFDGPSDGSSVQAMVAWRIDAVRVPLNEDCWLGINGVSRAVAGAAYRRAIEQYVQTLESHGMVAVLDLHWTAPGKNLASGQWPVPDRDHAPSFWTSVARAFTGNHGVIFDLFNEPYTSSWSCLLNGCTTRFKPARRVVSFQSAGMQTLVNAVRSTGATQPIMVGGLRYSSDDSQWLGFQPADPDHQLIVSFHTYNFGGCNTEACWNSTIAPLAARLPVVTGEFGENGCRQTYIDHYMSWADGHGVSYLAWAWDAAAPPSGWSCSGGPALIKNYRGTPTAFGAGLKSHLARLDLPPLP